MVLIELAVCLAVSLLIVTGTMATAAGQLAAIRSAQTLQFYSQDMATINLTIQKFVGGAATFNIYDTLADAQGGLGNQTGLTPGLPLGVNGTAVLLSYDADALRPAGGTAILFYMGSPSTVAGAPANSLCYQVPGNLPIVIATNISGVSFSTSDPTDPTGTATAAGLLVTVLQSDTSQVTMYAERF